jgi:hypothetical protein
LCVLTVLSLIASSLAISLMFFPSMIR